MTTVTQKITVFKKTLINGGLLMCFIFSASYMEQNTLLVTDHEVYKYQITP